MKIAISSKGNTLESATDPRFGRAQQFIIYDLDNGTHSTFNNTQNLTSSHGAGIQTAQNIINAGADLVITGNVGPNAFNVLNSAGVKIYLTSGLTVQEAIEKYKKGELENVSSNTVEGHWV